MVVAINKSFNYTCPFFGIYSKSILHRFGGMLACLTHMGLCSRNPILLNGWNQVRPIGHNYAMETLCFYYQNSQNISQDSRIMFIS